MSRRSWTKVRTHKRRIQSGKTVNVKRHRRRVTRQIPRHVVKSVSSIAQADREYGVGFDWDHKHSDLESILVIRGWKAATLTPSRAKFDLPVMVAADTPMDQRQYLVQRDFEVAAHSHPPDNNIGMKYPSPPDIISMIVDEEQMDREYELIFVKKF